MIFIKSRKLRSAWALSLMLLLVWMPMGCKQEAEPEETSETSEFLPLKYNIAFEEWSLRNGLDIVVIPLHKTPAVRVMLWFGVGGIDDPRGMEGMAHYFEHMMFKGSKHFAAGEHDRLISVVGGEHNAFTGQDFTAYYADVPAEHLELVMQLESDRLQYLEMNSKDLEAERGVILEERGSSVESNPKRLFAEQLLNALYRDADGDSLPYAEPVIGSSQSIQAITLPAMQAFRRAHYNISNATLVISGDVDVTKVRALVDKYFGIIAPGEVPTRPVMKANFMPKEHRVDFEDSRVKQKEWARYYLVPSEHYGDHSQIIPLTILAELLGGSETALLYQSMVVEQKMADGVAAYYDDMSWGPGQFVVSVVPTSGTTDEEIDQTITSTLQSVASNGVDDKALERIKRSLLASVVFAQDGYKTLGYYFGQIRVMGKDSNYLNHWIHEIEQVTAAQVQQAALVMLDNKAFVTGVLQGKSLQEPLPALGDQSEVSNESGMDDIGDEEQVPEPEPTPAPAPEPAGEESSDEAL